MATALCVAVRNGNDCPGAEETDLTNVHVRQGREMREEGEGLNYRQTGKEKVQQKNYRVFARIAFVVKKKLLKSFTVALRELKTLLQLPLQMLIANA